MSRPRTPRALPTRTTPVAGSGGHADPFGNPASLADTPGRALPLDAIVPNPDQPRRHFDTDALARLAESIRERGVLQPVLVRPTGGEWFALIAGERRWRAARLAELTTIPAYVRADTDDAAALELALIENAAREDLTAVEEARTLSTLIHDLGLTQTALAKRIGRSRSDLANTLRLLDLPHDVLDLIATGQLSKGHGKSLLAHPDPTARSRLARRAADGGWSVRQLERAIAAPAQQRPQSIAVGGRAVALELSERAASTIDLPVQVRTRGDGFSVQLHAADRASVEAILARLARDATP